MQILQNDHQRLLSGQRRQKLADGHVSPVLNLLGIGGRKCVVPRIVELQREQTTEQRPYLVALIVGDRPGIDQGL